MTNTRDTADHINEVPTIEANIASNTTQLARGNNHGKNLIINGDFQEDCWQRGTSDTLTTTETYLPDRWYAVNSTASTITLTQQAFTAGQTDVPNNPKYFYRMSWLGTGGATSPQTGTRLEDVTKLSGDEVTLSYHAKTGTDFDVEVYVVQNFGTGGSPSSEVVTLIDTESITSSWTKFEDTFTIPSVSGKTLGTNGDDYTEIRFLRNAGTAAGDLDISNVQLEFGDTATDFEYVNPADQLARCQRYFERIKTVGGSIHLNGGYAESSTEAQFNVTYTTKLQLPTLSASSSSALSITKTGATVAGTAVGFGLGGLTSSRCTVTTSGLTTGQGISGLLLSGEYIDIDAEL